MCLQVFLPATTSAGLSCQHSSSRAVLSALVNTQPSPQDRGQHEPRRAAGAHARSRSPPCAAGACFGSAHALPSRFFFLSRFACDLDIFPSSPSSPSSAAASASLAGGAAACVAAAAAGTGAVAGAMSAMATSATACARACACACSCASRILQRHEQGNQSACSLTSRTMPSKEVVLVSYAHKKGSGQSPDVCGRHAHARLLHPGRPMLLLPSRLLLRLLLACAGLPGGMLAPAGRLIRPPLPLVHGGMRHHLHACYELFSQPSQLPHQAGVLPLLAFGCSCTSGGGLAAARELGCTGTALEAPPLPAAPPEPPFCILGCGMPPFACAWGPRLP